jgi:hypothetical protein
MRWPWPTALAASSALVSSHIPGVLVRAAFDRGNNSVGPLVVIDGHVEEERCEFAIYAARSLVATNTG